jgi:1-acyl-sn-glycerol-3-phosphate acyltransferase
MVQDCVDTLRGGDNLIIFPEATRTVPGRPYDFQRGAANIALRAAPIVTPVTILCYPTTLTKSEKWHQIPWKRVHFRLYVGDDLDLSPFLTDGATPLAVRGFTDYLRDYFTRATGRTAHGDAAAPPEAGPAHAYTATAPDCRATGRPDTLPQGNRRSTEGRGEETGN